jgi:hypothetical protein
MHRVRLALKGVDSENDANRAGAGQAVAHTKADHA